MSVKTNSFFEKIHILQNIYLKNKYFFKKKSYEENGIVKFEIKERIRFQSKGDDRYKHLLK